MVCDFFKIVFLYTYCFNCTIRLKCLANRIKHRRNVFQPDRMLYKMRNFGKKLGRQQIVHYKK